MVIYTSQGKRTKRRKVSIMKKNLLNVNINGNKKLVNTDSIRFMIWNLPAQITCPFATEHCKASCYAKKAERVYPSVLPCREKNLEASKQDSFVNDMIQTIVYYLNSKSFTGKKCYFRIHESGDFYNKEYAKKWLAVCRWFARHNDKYGDKIQFLAYTKSVEYFKGEAIPENMIVRYSIWDDTDPRQLTIAEKMGLPIYTAVEKFAEDMEEEKKCNCADCATCGKCYKSGCKWIACEIH